MRIVLALALLAAASLKGYQLATSPVPEAGVLTARWFLIIVVEIEVALGIVLLSGVYSVQVRYLSGACFGIFGLVSLFRALHGESSCGCFGTVALDPWWTTLFDAAAVSALFIASPLRPQAGSVANETLRRRVVLVAILLIGVPGGISMAMYRPREVSPAGEVAVNGKVAYFDPARWVGLPFPLLSSISGGDELRKGAWTVLLFHQDCPACQAALAHFRRADPALRSKMVFVEIPPFGERHLASAQQDIPAMRFARLREGPKWFIIAPVAVSIKDGVVVGVDGPEQLRQFVSTL